MVSHISTPSIFSNLSHLAKVGLDFFEKSSINERVSPTPFLGIKLNTLTPSLFSNLDHLTKVGFDFFEKSSIKSIGGKFFFLKKTFQLLIYL